MTMNMNKKLFLVTVLILTVMCVFARQKNNGEIPVSGQQVYYNSEKVTWNARVTLGGTKITLGSIKKGILNITFPVLTGSGAGDKVWISIAFEDGTGAALRLHNVQDKDVVVFKFNRDEKKWVCASRNTGKEDTLENFYKSGYIWAAGQEFPF
jgi:hypothetical protein